MAWDVETNKHSIKEDAFDLHIFFSLCVCPFVYKTWSSYDQTTLFLKFAMPKFIFVLDYKVLTKSWLESLLTSTIFEVLCQIIINLTLETLISLITIFLNLTICCKIKLLILLHEMFYICPKLWEDIFKPTFSLIFIWIGLISYLTF